MPRGLLKGEAGLTVSSGPRLAGASDKADAGGLNSKRNPVPKRKAIASDIATDPMVIASWVGRTVKQQAACGPAWDSSSARDAGSRGLKRALVTGRGGVTLPVTRDGVLSAHAGCRGSGASQSR